MRNFYNKGALAALYKAASQGGGPQQSDSLYAAANMAKPPGAPPLPKPVNPKDDPAGAALDQQDAEMQQQKMEIEKQKQEAMHRKEIDTKDKEIASLRQDVQKANMEAQKARNELDLTKQRQSMLESIRSEQSKLDTRRDSMASEEAQHKSRLAESVADAKSQISEYKAKSTEQSAMQHAKMVEQNAMQNAKSYVKMTEDARKENDRMMAGARDEVMKQREDVLNQRETILADKAKAYDDRVKAESERNKTSPYLMKNLQDAASAARNISKLRDRSMNGMQNVFLSDMGKTAAAAGTPAQPQTSTAQYAPPAAASQQAATPAPPAAANTQPQRSGFQLHSGVMGHYDRSVRTNLRNDEKARIVDAYGGGDPTAAGYEMDSARFGNLAYQYERYGREMERDKDGNIIAAGKSERDGKGYSGTDSYRAELARELSDDARKRANERLEKIRGAAPGSAEAIEAARHKQLHYKRRGWWGSAENSAIDNMRNEARNADNEWRNNESSWWTKDMDWSNPMLYLRGIAKSPYYLGKMLTVDPFDAINNSVKDYNQTSDMANDYGVNWGVFGNKGASPGALQAWEDDAKALGLSTNKAWAAGKVGLNTTLAAASVIPVGAGAASLARVAGTGLAKGLTAGAARNMAGSMAGNTGKGLLSRSWGATKDAWKARSEALAASRNTGYADRGLLSRGYHKANDFMYGSIPRTAATVGGTVGGYMLGASRYNPDSMYGLGNQMEKMSASGNEVSSDDFIPVGGSNTEASDSPVTTADPSLAKEKGNEYTANWMNTGFNGQIANTLQARTNYNYSGKPLLNTIGRIAGGFLGVNLFNDSSHDGVNRIDPSRKAMLDQSIAAASFDVGSDQHYRNWNRATGSSNRVQEAMREAQLESLEDNQFNRNFTGNAYAWSGV